MIIGMESLSQERRLKDLGLFGFTKCGLKKDRGREIF